MKVVVLFFYSKEGNEEENWRGFFELGYIEKPKLFMLRLFNVCLNYFLEHLVVAITRAESPTSP